MSQLALEWALLIIFLTAIIIGAGVYAILIFRLRARRKRIEEEIFKKIGDKPLLQSLCTITRGASRVPGVVALGYNSIIYGSLILNFSGEIPLGKIKGVEVKKWLTGRGRYRKMIFGYKVLEIYFNSQIEKFFIKNSEVGLWEKEIKNLAPHLK